MNIKGKEGVVYMSEYSESLKNDELVKIYNDLILLGLPKSVLRILKKEGLNLDCEYMINEDTSRYPLSHLLNNKEAFDFLHRFVNAMKKKGYVLKRNGKCVSSKEVFNDIVVLQKVDLEEYSDDKSYYFEYDSSFDDSTHSNSKLPNTIYLVNMYVDSYPEHPEFIGYCSDDNSVDTVIFDGYLGTIQEVKRLLDEYSLNSKPYACVGVNGLICYNPLIIRKYIQTDNCYESYDDCSSLYYRFFGDVDNVDKVYSLFDKFCPCLVDGYTWSRAKKVSEKFNKFLGSVLDGYKGERVGHIYMKAGKPVFDFILEGNIVVAENVIEKIVGGIVFYFGNNIKEVYLVLSDGFLKYNEVIARKNDDGELTLTIY